jgi:hypothetical protein
MSTEQFQPQSQETIASLFKEESNELNRLIKKFILTNFLDVSILKVGCARKSLGFRLLSAVATELMQNGEKVVFINGKTFFKEINSTSEILLQQIAISNYLFIDQLELSDGNKKHDQKIHAFFKQYLKDEKKLIYTCPANKKALHTLLSIVLPDPLYALELQLVQKEISLATKNKSALNTARNQEVPLMKLHLKILNEKKKLVLLRIQKNHVIKMQAYQKAADLRDTEKVTLKKLNEMEEELHLLFNSFELIPENYTTLQDIKNVLLEFNTWDFAFRSDFAEIISVKQLEFHKKLDELTLSRKIAIAEAKIELSREIYYEMVELKNQIERNARIDLS